MSPLLEVNDVILSKSLTYDEARKIKVGDIITYKMTTSEISGYLNTHECVQEPTLDSESGEYYIKTQGKKSGAPIEIVYLDQIEGRMVIEIGFLGDIYTAIKTTTGIATLVIVPLILMLILSILRLVDIVKDRDGKKAYTKNKEKKNLTETEIEELTKKATDAIAKKAVEEYKLKLKKEEIAKQAILDYVKSLTNSSDQSKSSDTTNFEIFDDTLKNHLTKESHINTTIQDGTNTLKVEVYHITDEKASITENDQIATLSDDSSTTEIESKRETERLLDNSKSNEIVRKKSDEIE
jgi:hypothetical protein